MSQSNQGLIMKQTIHLSDFRDAFHKAGRGTQFSYQALELIYDYLIEMEQGEGEEFELDVIGLCCDISEDTPENIAKSYDIELADDGNELQNVLDDLYDSTTVIGTTDDGNIVYVQF
jgi:hypothetical protein